jgi:tetratricopeptide (TPR) repeat protein
MTLAEMIDLAKQVRALGDMQGALEVLKRADLRFPSAPEVLAETGLCYETMGLTDRATSAWKQLAAMDPTRAGGYGDLAKRKLNLEGELAPPAGAAPAPDFSGDFGTKVLSLGACTATRDTQAVNGEKVVLRIPILRRGNATIDPAQVDIDVYFFDRVNGEKIAQTIADEPLSAWGAPPVDWSGIGEEPLEVTYFLPTLTPGEVAAHGRRAYHGYVVRLYYQHKLQDAVAEPRDLLDFGSASGLPQAAPAGGMNPLLPPVSN